MKQWFDKFATRAADWGASEWTFCAACIMILAWLVSGPFMKFSDMWHLWINTPTTIITFLNSFIIQYQGKKDTAAINAKLDEEIRVDPKADNNLIGVERAHA